ncbi:MAG: ATP/GTP-binding protein [Bacteroidota bacterium]|nr:ATP/GTP-binding protein [Bacteroidota bacterium]
MKLRIFYLGVFLFLGLTSFSQTLTWQWTTADGLKTPESILYDVSSNNIFVSNIDGQPSEKDGNGFISVLGAEGKLKTLKWITGLNAPKGLAIHNGNLYVADIDELVVINIKESKITNRYKVENAKFLNDVTAGEDGIVFVSDMQDHKIYALENDKLSLWLDDKLLENVNGLWAENGQLYIGTAQVLQADIKTKTIKILVENCGGIDGLEKLKDGNFIYSNWQGHIFITKGTESFKLLDTVDKKNTADIDFVPGKNLVLVPTFSGNSVEAYELKPE